ncbi:hypothetical protein Tco_1006053 [Tanacetum coccineum]|uniref:CCHC-type domain-containing protein n=1 Tax=Tanacetum coccineum TaxID=301880 RepID=A0ABQ5FHT2_9ASTR
MSSNSDDIQAAGSDTRPPMLDRTDYESCLEPQGKGYTSELPLEGRCQFLAPERPRTYDDLNDDEKKRYDADVRVLSSPKEDRESQLVMMNLEPFKMLPGEKNINEYYVRFHKLVNDMRNIRMTMPNIQLNSKFVNNMSPEWDRFVTAVKLNKGLKETNHEQLYAYLKQHEKHAAQDRLIIERITPSTNDPLAFVSSVQPYSQPSQSQSHQYQSSTTPPQSQNVQSIPYSQFAESSSPDSGYTQTEEILNTLSKQFALLTQSFRATLPQTNNQLRTSSNTRNQATIQDGQIVVQNVQGRQNQNQRNFARGNGAAGFGGMQNRAGNVNAGQGRLIKCYNCNGMRHIARNFLDEEELLFLAGEQGNTFDADVDNQPTIFMANLSSAGSANPQFGPSNASILSEVHILENAIDHSATTQNKLEIHNEVQQSNVSDSTSVHIGAQNPFYLKKAKVNQPSLYDGNELINLDHHPIDIPSLEEELVLAELTRQKMHEKLNDPTMLKPLKQVFWSLDLSLKRFEGQELKGQRPTLPVMIPATVYPPTTPVIGSLKLFQQQSITEVRAMKAVFEEMEAEVDQNAIDKKYREIERKDLLIINENLIANCIAQDVAHVNLQLKQQHLKENANNLKSKSPRDVPEFDVFFELGMRDDQIQSHKNTIRKLKAQISELKANKKDFKAENAKIKLHYQELFNSIKVTRVQTTEKAKSLQHEIENLRAQLKGKMPFVASDVKTPKVFAFEKYEIDVEPISLRLKKNQEVHLHYIKRLRENVETLRKIVEDAKVERPLDTSLASAFRYTKHSQELRKSALSSSGVKARSNTKEKIGPCQQDVP